jgi:hypothetical protein
MCLYHAISGVLLWSYRIDSGFYTMSACISTSRIFPTKRYWLGHSWKKQYWNSGFYYQQAIGREGSYCVNCGKMIWPQTDQEFFDGLPEWLKKKIPEQNPELYTVSTL